MVINDHQFLKNSEKRNRTYWVCRFRKKLNCPAKVTKFGNEVTPSKCFQIDVKFSQTNHKNLCIYVNGQKFLKSDKSDTNIFWVCSQKRKNKCKARIRQHEDFFLPLSTSDKATNDQTFEHKKINEENLVIKYKMSSRNNLIMVINDHQFVKYSEKGNRSYWGCKLRNKLNCPAKVTKVGSKVTPSKCFQHNHLRTWKSNLLGMQIQNTIKMSSEGLPNRRQSGSN
ncbi:CLUMA_CG005552, isoform A [Clunio marinus]|uniref:CLUMA_CG005552, isoform A n=1 Tax=Clunio marinus TaxID=568069 RepID=A0A1J1HZG6_9DIPT|nr:CLUMA_CG005552, isoform A [Clunio marinus]